MLRQASRSLARSPGFVALAVLTLAVGIASATALFSVVNAVLLQPLAFPDPDRVVAVNTDWPAQGHTSPRITGGDFVDLRSQAHTLSAISYYAGGEIGVRLRDHARFAETYFADAAFFRVLGIRPAVGRLPESADSGRTAVVSASFARANWDDASAALGQAVVVDNRAYTVSGVIPDPLAFPEKGEVWITAEAVPENLNRTAFNYKAIARVRPDKSLSQAQAELSTIAARLADVHRDSNSGKTFDIRPLRDQLTAPIRVTVLFLFGAAGLLLLIACANAANLMLARTATRMREIAVRISLGSGLGAILRLLLAEGCILGACAAILGIALTYAGLRLCQPLLPASLPRITSVTEIHPLVLVFCAGASVFTVLACSLLPVAFLRRLDSAEVLRKSTGRTVAGGAGRFRQAIVVAQIALCCMLCVSAALLARTFVSLAQTPLGFESEHIAVMYADAPAYQLSEYLQAIRTFETTLDRIRAIHGVRAAAAIMGLPTGRYGSNGGYLVEGVNIQPGQNPLEMRWPQNAPYATFAVASPDYFRTIGIRLLAGRDFNSHDSYTAPYTAIVSEALARQSFGSENPIGKRIYCGLDSPKPMTIVGIVSDVRQDSPSSPPGPEIYMPFQQHPYHANELEIVVRTNGSPDAIIPVLRRTMQNVSPQVAVDFSTLTRMVEDSIAAPRFRGALAVAFALLALLLALTGIYGVLAYLVAQRTTEMGVRMALGADRISILGLISRHALTLGGFGVSIGVIGSVLVSRVATTFLFGVRALDPGSYLLAMAAVLAVVLAAASIPAWRAASVDPAVALRNE